jgi:hypothetical protein
MVLGIQILPGNLAWYSSHSMTFDSLNQVIPVVMSWNTPQYIVPKGARLQPPPRLIPRLLRENQVDRNSQPKRPLPVPISASPEAWPTEQAGQ